jgi:hypothetical protein
VASVWVHERQHTGQTMSQVMVAFRERFNKAPPRKATLLDWEFMVAYWSVYGDFSATLYMPEGLGHLFFMLSECCL